VERVQRLELVVRQRRRNDGIDSARVVSSHPTNQVVDICFQVCSRRRRDESCRLDGQVRGRGPALSDDDLDGPDLP